MVLRAEMRGDRPSNRRFVEAGVGKGHTERFHLGVALGQCDDGGGIHAARQEGRHRDVRDQMRPHAGLQLLRQGFDGVNTA